MKMGLRIENLSTGYPKRQIIKELSVSMLPQGQITVLLGPNGSGKSTLLRALAGLNPATGKLWLGPDELVSLPFSRRAELVVYLPQTLPAGVHLNVLESIIVAQRASGKNDNVTTESEIMDLLEQLGIGHLALSYLDELSGGQKQMVGLAQSLVRQPSLLLLDEPLSALDLNYQFHVMDLIKKETTKRNIVTVVVVHDINIALRHGDYVLMLENGVLVADGPPEYVITPEHLAAVYGVSARIEHCSRGMRQVFIDGLIKNLQQI
ncbi:ABC transporter ATP-binding protein [Escherichia coli]|uniref:ABC transporter ATP-binding protein n=1 Tax=Escherichia coli TaxID=562 RepID=UPI001F0FC246|nr:ABC transporter ATP-binding protein [Escherichia coli]UMS28657.1 iron ABC transporter ATP-binding protein [Escherichia coli]